MNIRVDKLIEMVDKGRIFSVCFIKRTDGSRREMLCRYGVQSARTGGDRAYEFEERGLLPVFDMQKQGYRCIPVENIISIKIDGETYEIMKE